MTTDISQQRKALIDRILNGAGTASQSERQPAFKNIGLTEQAKTFIQKVAAQPPAVTDSDVAAALASRLSDGQIFEIVICAAIGQSTRQYDSARVALERSLSAAHL